VRILHEDYTVGIRIARLLQGYEVTTGHPSKTVITINPPILIRLFITGSAELSHKKKRSLQVSEYLFFKERGNARVGLFYPSWAILLQGLNPTTVHLVGVGNGVAAVAALDVGSLRVIGHDQAIEYDVRRVRSNYPPQAVALSSAAERFTWHPSSFDPSSDLTTWISELVSSSSNSSSTVFIVDVIPRLISDDVCRLARVRHRTAALIVKVEGSVQDIFSLESKLQIISQDILSAIETIADRSFGYFVIPSSFVTAGWYQYSDFQGSTSSHRLNLRQSVHLTKVEDRVAVLNQCSSLLFGCRYRRNELKAVQESFCLLIGKGIHRDDYHTWSKRLCSNVILSIVLGDTTEQEMLNATFHQSERAIMVLKGLVMPVETWRPYFMAHYQSICIVVANSFLLD
jgi:hypothetical protein